MVDSVTRPTPVLVSALYKPPPSAVAALNWTLSLPTKTVAWLASALVTSLKMPAPFWAALFCTARPKSDSVAWLTSAVRSVLAIAPPPAPARLLKKMLVLVPKIWLVPVTKKDALAVRDRLRKLSIPPPAPVAVLLLKLLSVTETLTL